jgi:hypothetical protein
LIDWSNTARASTTPSTSVTVTQHCTPSAKRFIMRLAAEPCR